MSPGLLEVAVIVTVCVLSFDGPGLMPLRLTVWIPAFSRRVRLFKPFKAGG